MGNDAVILEAAPEEVEAKGAEIFENPGEQNRRRVGHPHHVEGLGVVGEDQRAVPPLAPPEGLAADGELHGPELQGGLALEQPQGGAAVFAILLPRLDQGAPREEKHAAEAGVALEGELAVLVVGVADAEIIGIEGELMGIGAGKAGVFAVLIDIGEFELAERLEIARGRAAVLQLRKLLVQLALQAIKQLVDDGGHRVEGGVLPRLGHLPGGLEAAVGPIPLDGGLNQAETAQLVEGGIDPAVEGKIGRGGGGEGGEGEEQNPRQYQKKANELQLSNPPCNPFEVRRK